MKTQALAHKTCIFMKTMGLDQKHAPAPRVSARAMAQTFRFRSAGPGLRGRTPLGLGLPVGVPCLSPAPASAATALDARSPALAEDIPRLDQGTAGMMTPRIVIPAKGCHPP